MVEASNPLASSTKSGAEPKCLDDFEVHKQVGEGSFGMVYLAEEKATGHPVAIK